MVLKNKLGLQDAVEFAKVEEELTKRKALILPYKSLLNVKNTLKPIKDFQINRFNLSIDIGSNDEIYTPLYIGYLTGLVSDSLGKFLSKSKPYLKFNTNVNVYNYSVLNFYLHGKLTFNFLVVFLEILRFLLEKIINVFKLQKQ